MSGSPYQNPLYHVIDVGVTPAVIAIIAQTACNVLPYQTPSPTSPNSIAAHAVKVPPMHSFISKLAVSSRVNAGTLISTMVYLDRLKQIMPSNATAMTCTNHRIFLASLILAGKYLNDASPKNKYWARFSENFSLAEVNLMEQQLMQLLNYQFEITEAQLLQQLQRFAHLLTPPVSPMGFPAKYSAAAEAYPLASSVAAGATNGLATMTPARTPSSNQHNPNPSAHPVINLVPSPLELNYPSITPSISTTGGSGTMTSCTGMNLPISANTAISSVPTHPPPVYWYPCVVPVLSSAPSGHHVVSSAVYHPIASTDSLTQPSTSTQAATSLSNWRQ
ncbi:PHO85 cyclin-1 [Dispira parvispora]|uniref:PHO85 cyclin-1 n=1 Tax=Dispira parvispora TaxID=1520584 RepID=A0A9W8AUW2_9FUNG|nr:PHO85 cyclin-1 [Dispira parvispora]